MDSLTKTQCAAAIIGGATIAAAAAWTSRHLYQRYTYWNAPFVYCGKVKELFVFPIKSAKSIEVDWLDCSSDGAEHCENKDRHFVFVDAKRDHLFLTARQYPKLVLIEPTVQDGILTVKIPEKGEYAIDMIEVADNNDVRQAILWTNKKAQGLDCGDEVGRAVSEYLGVADKRDIRLLYFGEGLDTERYFTTNNSFWINPVPTVDERPAYQDLATYMLCTQASLDDLNTRIPEAVQMKNFRPNINVEGTLPYDEDSWLYVKIGDDVEFACYKPCTRCVLTTVNVDKGAFIADNQPLRELRNYRLAPEGKLRDLYNQSPIFGVNMSIIKPGRIQRGDLVYVSRKPTPY